MMIPIKLRVALAAVSVGLLTGCDLATKAIAKAKLAGGPAVPVIPGFWNMKYAENRDVGFSLLSAIPHGARQPLIFALVTVGLIAVSIYGLRRVQATKALLGSILITSGALGNLIDRAANGYVTDFVQWYVGRFSWPVFNVADVCVVVGVGLVLWHEWTQPAEAAAAPPDTA